MIRALVLTAAAALAPVLTARAVTPAFLGGTPAGTIESALINEASGLAASRQHPHVLWTHNDSGDSARLYAIHPSGRLLGVYTLAGASAVDWEDMALGPDPGSGVHYLYAGDIGDNSAARGSITVYRVPEPIVSAQQDAVTTNLTGVEALVYTYPDGARDAETLLADPLTGDLFVISKPAPRSRIYRAPYPQNPSGTDALEYLGELTIGVTTGGDISPSGSQILVRKYYSMHYYQRAAGQTVAQTLTGTPAAVPCTFELQGEAVAWQGQERGYYTLSEFSFQPIYHYASLDTDGDDLTDSEEIAWGADMTEPDSDGDGHVDGHEVVAGESPTDTASVFRVLGQTVASGGAEVAWLGRSNRLYDVQVTTDSLAGSPLFTTAITGLVAGTDGLIVTNVPAAGSPFYIRLRVQREDGW